MTGVKRFYVKKWEKVEFEEIKALFEQYSEATGGSDPIGLIVPNGFPTGSKRSIDSWEDVAEVYREAIEQNITWEELIGYEAPPYD